MRWRRRGRGSCLRGVADGLGVPDWLLAAYREGRCRGLRELYELRKLPGADAWLDEDGGRMAIRCDSDLAALLDDLEAAVADLPPADALLLEGTSPGGATPYDEWLEVERARVGIILLKTIKNSLRTHLFSSLKTSIKNSITHSSPISPNTQTTPFLISLFSSSKAFIN